MLRDAQEQEGVFRTALTEAVRGMGISLDESHISAMWRHFRAVVEQNAVMNLTRITEPAEAAVKHYADSLALAAWANGGQFRIHSLLDVGTGAGFPAVPLAILRPEWSITAIDGTRKKIEFVRRCATELGLTNLRPEHAHASHWPAAERFDVVTLRAVSKLGEAIETCSRFLNRPGWLVIYKTAQVEETERARGHLAAKARGLDGMCFPYEIVDRGQRLGRTLFVYGAS